MLIDWFTVAAQIVNFLILVWLLKRFLYAPVLNAIDAREKRIAAQIEQAESQRSQAEAERSRYELKNREITTERERLLNAARAAADEERVTLLQQARAQHERLRERLAAEMSEQRDELTRSLASRLEAELFETARRLIVDLSDGNLEDAIVAVFVRRLHSLSEEDRAALRRDLASGTSEASCAMTLRSAFELSSAQRTAVETELKQIARGIKAPRYEHSPDLVGGVELVANGYRLSWSVEDYLGSLREKVELALRSVAEI